MCICVDFVKCGCVYVLVLLCVGVLVICVLVFTVFCIVPRPTLSHCIIQWCMIYDAECVVK